MAQQKKIAIHFEKITKKFGKFVALKDVSFSIKEGNVHAIVGENGAGKTTLMLILSGFLQPSEGTLFIDSREVVVKDPSTASKLGIAMVHQHFMQINNYTNLENIMLGNEFLTKYGFLNKIIAKEKVKHFQKQFHLDFDLDKLTREEVLANKQKIEIIKLLFRDAEILIFDEPTAILTDSEIKGFLKTIASLKAQGKTIIFITHKLQEVQDICDEITVLRGGEVVATNLPGKTPVEEVAEIMLGQDIVLPSNTHKRHKKIKAIEFKNVSYLGNHVKLNNLNFSVYEGEILSFAGVAGNGQEELEMLISGILKPTTGKILFWGQEVTKLSPKVRKKIGLSYIPNDIHKYGCVKSFNLSRNLVLRELDNNYYFTKLLGFFRQKNANRGVKKIVNLFDVRGVDSQHKKIGDLSGGNQQKFIFGRERESQHKILLVANPTRGLDLKATKNIHSHILSEKEDGKAVILISYILDEVLALADRIIVLNKGQITLDESFEKVTKEKLNIHFSGFKGEGL